MAQDKYWDGTKWVPISASYEEFTTHLAEDAIDAHNAKNISIIDSTNKFTATDVEGALSELFLFASDGKTAVASAITAKGVAASPSDAFPTLATKIGQIITEPVSATGTANTGSVSILTVSGLSFQPSRIEIRYTSDPYKLFTLYDIGFSTTKTVFCNTTEGVAGEATISTYAGYVNSSGFKLPFLNGTAFPGQGSNYPVTWKAIK
ncbi:hypothetical protein [Sporosarcina sp. FA9]|uniref:hypothetical protein n=1 Tax=Sporosarcina sp. FA9 TaxID=3413030 RepID=UPI003F6609A8